MKRLIVYIIFLCAYVGIIEAQNVTNVEFHQEGNKVVITYELDEATDISIRISTDGGKTFSKPLIWVSGDVGVNVSAGKNKIIWDVLNETEIAGDNIIFQIDAKEKPRKEKPRIETKRTSSKYSNVGAYNEYQFQCYVLMDVNSASEFKMFEGTTKSTAGLGGEFSLGVRLKKFAYIGAQIGMNYYYQDSETIWITDKDKLININRWQPVFPIGLHVMGYLPTNRNAINRDFYPYLTATIGGYIGKAKGVNYHIGVGMDCIRGYVSMSFGYMGYRGAISDNQFCFKLGLRLGKK